MNFSIKFAIKKYMERKPKIASALLAKTMNGSSVTAKIAGIESTAKTRSINSTMMSTRKSGVK
jgi:hypothetical protein